MKSYIFAAIMSTLVACAGGNGVRAAAEQSTEPVTFEVDSPHTRIVWEVATGSGIFVGIFRGATGEVRYDEANPEKSAVHIEIAMDRLMTGVDELDEKLKSGEFFDAESFPSIIFDSTSIELTGEKSAIISGDLTMHGVKRPVVLNAVFRNRVDFGTSERLAFGATTAISRNEFGVTAMEDWLSDEIKIRIELETGRRKPAPKDAE